MTERQREVTSKFNVFHSVTVQGIERFEIVVESCLTPAGVMYCSDHGDGVVAVTYIYVVDQLRRCGLGTNLMKYAREIFPNCKWITQRCADDAAEQFARHNEIEIRS